MNERFACPGCRSPLLAPADARGARVQCPRCGATFSLQPATAPTDAIHATVSVASSVRNDDSSAARTRWKHSDTAPLDPEAFKLHPLSALTIALVVGLALNLLLDLFAVCFSVRVGEPPLLNRRGWPREPLVFYAISSLLLTLVTGILFSMWMARAYANAERLGTTKLRYSPSTAALVFLIPIVNILCPYPITRELWRVTSLGRRPTADPMAKRRNDRSVVMIAWAVCWFGVGLLGVVTAPFLDPTAAKDAVLAVGTLPIALRALAALFGIWMMLSLHRRLAAFAAQARPAENGDIPLGVRP